MAAAGRGRRRPGDREPARRRAGRDVHGRGRFSPVGDAAVGRGPGRRQGHAHAAKGGRSAILHEEYPVRFWDHDLGPDRSACSPRTATGTCATSPATSAGRWTRKPPGTSRPTAAPWSPPGRWPNRRVAAGHPGGDRRRDRRAAQSLADDADHEYHSPRVSPDGTRVAVVVRRRSGPEDPGDSWLALVPLGRRPGPGPDRRLGPLAARRRGGRRTAPRWWWRPTTTGARRCGGWTPRPARSTRLTHDDGAYTDVQIAPDGRWVYALRNAIDSPPGPVRIALDGASAVAAPARPGRGAASAAYPVGSRRSPPPPPTGPRCAPGSRCRTTPTRPRHRCCCGSTVARSSPGTAGPGGGTRGSRWRRATRCCCPIRPCPPATASTSSSAAGARWGDTPYTDLMAITDAAEERPDIDAEPYRRDGWLVRRLHGQLDRRAHRPVRRDRHARVAVGARPDDDDHRRRPTTGPRDDRGAAEANSPHRFADASPRRCW